MKTRFLAILAIVLSLCIGTSHGAAVGALCATASAAALIPPAAWGHCFVVGPLTLLDLAIRGGDEIATIVDDVTTVAPEWGIIPAVPREGTSYDVLRRVGLPNGGFRVVGGGVIPTKGQWDRETKPMYFFDAPMDIDEAIVQAQTGSSIARTGDVLMDEASATVRGSTNNFGQQFYYGGKVDVKGFAGLATQSFYDEDCGGATTATTASAYLVWLDPSPTNPQGVSFSVGRKGKFSFGDFQKQQITNPTDGSKAMHYVNNFSFYVGLCVASDKAVFRAIKIDAAHPLTDMLGAKIISKVPLGRRANLRWFMNSNTGYLLQQSRVTALVVNPEFPTNIQNIPITYTDSLVSIEKNGNLA